MEMMRQWLARQLANPQVVILALLLVAGFSVVLLMGDMLAPVLAAVVIAYLLEGVVGPLERRGVPRLLATAVVFFGFMAFVLFLVFGLAPLISRQVTQLVQQLPGMIASGQAVLERLPERYPQFVTQEQVQALIEAVRAEVAALGQEVLSRSVTSVIGVATFVVYVVLVPILVFFMLKDKARILAWFDRYLPRERELAVRVWHEVDHQIGNYIRGKFWEILIVWGVTFLTFQLLGLQFAMLLSLIVGVSVIIPFIGAVAATVPVALVGYFQWGWSSEFAWLMAAYTVIQVLDGNVLVPLLFSEAVDLHPVAIIVAVLFFGGLWGFWGVFFAIPLAVLVKAVLNALPGPEDAEGDEAGGPPGARTGEEAPPAGAPAAGEAAGGERG